MSEPLCECRRRPVRECWDCFTPLCQECALSSRGDSRTRCRACDKPGAPFTPLLPAPPHWAPLFMPLLFAPLDNQSGTQAPCCQRRLTCTHQCRIPGRRPPAPPCNLRERCHRRRPHQGNARHCPPTGSAAARPSGPCTQCPNSHLFPHRPRVTPPRRGPPVPSSRLSLSRRGYRRCSRRHQSGDACLRPPCGPTSPSIRVTTDSAFTVARC